MPGRVSSPVFVGRRAELDRILAALEAARTGHGRLILIAGEAGVGKTRLVEEAVCLAREAEGLAVVGRCVELGAAGIPFAALRSAVHELTIALGEQRVAQLGGGKSVLASMRPSFDLGSAFGERTGVGADSSQIRFFEACIELFRGVAVEMPLMLIIEDLHWADPSTLDLLSYLARAMPETPFVIVATFRSDELHRRHPLQPFLGEIQRLQATERIDLKRFTEDELAEQLAAILGRPADPEMLRRVLRRSDGNAFYAEEVAAVEGSGEPLPQAMRDVLLARVAALSDPAQELLRVVAAGGTSVWTSTLESVGLSAPAQLEACLREAVDRHLLVPVAANGDEQVSFRHALVQEAVYGELLPGERTRLHTRYGEALQAKAALDPALNAELAYHWYAAHDLPRALTASIEAARWAETRTAYADAQRQYERALELWDRVPDAAERTQMDLIGLLERAASAAAEASPPRAAALMLDAIRMAEGRVDLTRAGLLKERYGRYAWLAGDGITAIDACRAAVALVPDQPATRARARVLASLGQILMITLQSEEALDVCQQAVEAARSVGATDVECHALNSLGASNAYLGNLEAGLEQLQASVDLAMRSGYLDDVARGHGNIVDALSHSGRLEEAGEAALSAFGYAQEHGLARVVGAIGLAEGALAFYRLGRWGDATELLQRASRLGISGVPRILVEERLALLDVGQGRHEAATARVAFVRPLIERAVEGQLIAPLAEAAAELSLWRRQPLQARAEIDGALDRLSALPGYISRLGPLFALATRAEADIAEMARANKDNHRLSSSRTAAAAHLETMRQLQEAAAQRLPNFASQADAWLAACRAEMTRVEGNYDAAAWEHSASVFAGIPMPYPRAYAMWRQAEVEWATSRSRANVAPRLQDAYGICIGLGAGPLAAEISALAARAGIDLGEAASRDLAATSADRAGLSLGLTRRELEILKLMAIGRTNRQIAEELFITEGTAGTHVSNILGKLGVRARTEAAAVAFKLGLVE